MSCDNILQCPVGPYMYVCVSVSHTHTYTLTHTCTYTDNCLQFHLGLCCYATLYRCLNHVWDPLSWQMGEMAEKKKAGLIVSEILLLNCTLGWIIFFCGSSLKRANSLWSSRRDLLTDHTLIVMLGEYWKRGIHILTTIFPLLVN